MSGYTLQNNTGKDLFWTYNTGGIPSKTSPYLRTLHDDSITGHIGSGRLAIYPKMLTKSQKDAKGSCFNKSFKLPAKPTYSNITMTTDQKSNMLYSLNGATPVQAQKCKGPPPPLEYAIHNSLTIPLYYKVGTAVYGPVKPNITSGCVESDKAGIILGSKTAPILWTGTVIPNIVCNKGIITVDKNSEGYIITASDGSVLFQQKKSGGGTGGGTVSKTKLSVVDIILIVIGSIIGFLLLLALVMWLIFRKKKKSSFRSRRKRW